MYAIWTLFTLGPGMRETADTMGEKWIPILRAMPGFVSGTFLRDEEAGEYGAMTLWESRAAAESALAETERPFQEEVAHIAQGPPTRTLLAVWQQVGPA